ncbi:hypothetical protein GLOIN_2v1635319 [Rhizophagus irregularis DAOM 181602=DAOM 197198]|uniref:Uncharacterized protein n=1 Tax=Rhizophagus irregularis (strain DAOM 181602 / DAOM 197198 / MUCL 43194) TaxID=747089 RepID=A0A2P4PT98_RHIID|nr:hypothetical protein GLOIN_2v1635319 [Rhizophagus irregularis DAOM 181602=DAOM 197198]POG68611.1 hypothetical protein GLOIN_2v1635319 [Rhizophagus irregularis DAOM 181602=DAOM 197198]|eukprot:XP_025175477.1 hypothetical protein GLOIN_2v1635319 [Rhizophagus irregularis DAOM 181602=DAOM 197198]
MARKKNIITLSLLLCLSLYEGKILTYVSHAFYQFRHNRDTKNGLSIRGTIALQIDFLTRVDAYHKSHANIY